VLYRDHARGRDDMTVLVARVAQGARKVHAVGEAA
jgi:hypothetical protein